jgi:RNA polymerase sigma-70 factor (ECF subfamily)
LQKKVMAFSSSLGRSAPAERDEEAPAVPVLTPDSSASTMLRQLLAEHLDFVWRSLRRLGVLSGEVDDAAQRVFLIANQKLTQIQPGRERSFLVGVATRVASHARRAHRRRERGEQRWSTHPREPNPDPEELTQELEARALLDEVLDAMPEGLRAVFILFELEELSIDEIAHLLELPRGTVATRLRRAREVFHAQARLAKASADLPETKHE